tara:strand:+ start:3433 stop:3645 length:213 start_codon:yes stop_codon:yes gene_type:complete
VCQSFNCTPNVALQEDARQVVAILEYRMAKEAQRMMNDTQSGMKDMATQPELVRLWKVLCDLEEEDGDWR